LSVVLTIVAVYSLWFDLCFSLSREHLWFELFFNMPLFEWNMWSCNGLLFKQIMQRRLEWR